MQIVEKRQALKIPPLLRLAFRPFFLFGSLFAVLAITLWVHAYLGMTGGWQPQGGWLAWHRHELVFGFAAAIIAGFLLTAVQTWTGRPSLSGWPLAGLFGVWLGARLSWLPGSPLWLLLALNLLFLLLVALAMARLLWAVRQQKNYPVVAILLLLWLADAQCLAGLALDDQDWQRRAVLAAVWLVAAMMTLIGGRVIPFFIQRGLNRATAVAPLVWLDWALLLGTALVALLHAGGVALQPSPLVGLLFLLLALGHGLRLLRWQDRGLWRVPLLWSLYLAYAWLVLACAGMALWHAGWLASSSQALHALTVGGMAGLILAMLARVSLGHTGRPLVLPRGMSWAFALLNAGAFARVFLVGLWPQGSLWLALLCWTLAFGLFLWRYAPMLCRTRADGHPG
ncbi:NnrS family protein [Pseudomonas sp. N040]|uniref:NnrS family protein n=1 Tax=Pseudomonas sp. N040 TaxID=2785325 RepID=UPI0018A27EB9|nr:NnrS family protein [Pseudomonas sp. N040]MBF7728680.1 NnrS family protein [Pseudomonas sp. N040]MBW7012320.1 NnrS family protein [Pseudomonas sp. N040]